METKATTSRVKKQEKHSNINNSNSQDVVIFPEHRKQKQKKSCQVSALLLYISLYAQIKKSERLELFFLWSTSGPGCPELPLHT